MNIFIHAPLHLLFFRRLFLWLNKKVIYLQSLKMKEYAEYI